MAKIIHKKSEKIFNTILTDQEVKKHLTDLEQHHKETYEHSARVALLCIDLAIENNLSENEIFLAGKAGFLHDVGKKQVENNTLSKTGSLNKKEQILIAEHVREGFLILSHFSDRETRKVIIGHHEYKREAYPRNGDNVTYIKNGGIERRRKEKHITDITQILAAADMFDALASPRSYKKAFSKEEVAELMHKQFTGDSKYIAQLLRRFE